MIDTLHTFLAGAITLGYAVLGLFFLRFWRRTRDSLFASFAIAFFLLALNVVAATLAGPDEFHHAYIYLLRLAAFGLIIAAIIAKNMGVRSRR
jgi:hypothetical protein